MSLICKECSGDVVRFFVGPIEKTKHAVPGIDHGPIPIEVPDFRLARNGAHGGHPSPAGPAEPHPWRSDDGFPGRNPTAAT